MNTSMPMRYANLVSNEDETDGEHAIGVEAKLTGVTAWAVWITSNYKKYRHLKSGGVYYVISGSNSAVVVDDGVEFKTIPEIVYASSDFSEFYVRMPDDFNAVFELIT